MSARRQIKRNARTTIEQLNAFLTFLEVNPEFFRSNPVKRDAKYTSGKWNELTFILNSLRGPTKSPKEWKFSLIHWKNQLRSRTRKLRAEQIDTDDGSSSQTRTLSTLEERALSLFGELPLDSIGISVQHKTSKSNLMESMQSPSSDVSIKIEQNDLDVHDDSEDNEPSSTRKRLNSNSMETTYKRSRFHENRDEFDRRISEERLEIERMNCDAVNKMANAVSKMADALLIFAQAYASK